MPNFGRFLPGQHSSDYKLLGGVPDYGAYVIDEPLGLSHSRRSRHSSRKSGRGRAVSRRSRRSRHSSHRSGGSRRSSRHSSRRSGGSRAVSRHSRRALSSHRSGGSRRSSRHSRKSQRSVRFGGSRHSSRRSSRRSRSIRGGRSFAARLRSRAEKAFKPVGRELKSVAQDVYNRATPIVHQAYNDLKSQAVGELKRGVATGLASLASGAAASGGRRYRKKRSARGGARSVRGAMVSKLMRQHGMGLGEASRYIADHKMY